MKKVKLFCVFIATVFLISGCSSSKSEEFYYERCQKHISEFVEEYRIQRKKQDDKERKYYSIHDETKYYAGPEAPDEYEYIHYEKHDGYCDVKGAFNLLGEFQKIKRTFKFTCRVKNDGSCSFTKIIDEMNTDYLNKWLDYKNYTPSN